MQILLQNMWCRCSGGWKHTKSIKTMLKHALQFPTGAFPVATHLQCIASVATLLTAKVASHGSAWMTKSARMQCHEYWWTMWEPTTPRLRAHNGAGAAQWTKPHHEPGHQNSKSMSSLIYFQKFTWSWMEWFLYLHCDVGTFSQLSLN